MMRRFFILTLLCLGLFLTGCGKPWKVIQQAEPNPFIGKKEFVVMPVDYSGLMVGSKTEEEYLSEKKDKTVDSFQADKVDMNSLVLDNMRSVASKNGVKIATAEGEVTTFVIKPHIPFMEPGFYAVVVSKASEVKMRLKIEDKDGKLLDEIEIRHQTPPSNWGNVASGSRYRSDAEAIGKIVGRYISERVMGTEP
ncbi:MAG: hypothetical protein IPG04_05820 [Polyangiaceae bacterium]|jgi:hypothetical protein|nr:hypothetical protein [Polyangiaceae bacterium]